MGQNNILNKYVNINKIWVQKDEWGSDGTHRLPWAVLESVILL